MTKLLLTGGCGFIGHHFCEHLLKNTDWNVVILDSLNYAGDVGKLLDIDGYDKSRVSIYWHDLRAPIMNSLAKRIGDIDYIVNMASGSDVERSIEEPVPFIHNNVMLSLNTLEYARQVKPKKYVQVSCYDENTQALTKDGLKKYDQIHIGDEVMSINQDTNQIEWKKVQKVIVQDYDGEMINFLDSRTDLMVTPNHRMYYTKNIQKTEIHVDTAENLASKSSTYMPQGQWLGKSQNNINIPGIGLVPTKELFYLSGFFIADGCVCTQTKQSACISGLTKVDRLVQCRDKKTGRFYSTPKLGVKIQTESTTYRIYLDVPEKDKGRKRLEATLKALNIKYTTPKNKSGEHIYFSSKAWSEYFTTFGKYAKNKKIAEWMLDYSPEYLSYLFDGLIDGDGCHLSHGRKTYTTVSYKLLEQLIELGYKLGYRTRYKHIYSESTFEERIIKGWSYCLHFIAQEHKVRLNKYNAKKINYRGKIWCVTVEDNKNLFTERNGKISIAGNTDEVYGPADYPYNEWDRHAPSNPYSASKSAQEAITVAYWRTYNVPAFISVTMNNFGERQHPEKLVPKTIKYLLEGKKIPIHAEYKDGNWFPGSRTWLHARNHADALIWLLNNYEPVMFPQASLPGKFNIAGEKELTNVEVVCKIASIMGVAPQYEFVDFHSSRPGHDRRYALNSDKLRQIGWIPPLGLDQSFQRMVEWSVKNKIWLM